MRAVNSRSTRKAAHNWSLASAARYSIDPLERRVLLASIAGTVFYDIDADGVIDGVDSGLAGWKVYLDANNNGVRDTNPPVSINSSNVPKTIVDVGSVTSNNVISGLVGSVFDVNVKVSLTHTYDSDLILTLISPTGTQVVLANRVGGSGNNFTNTIFDDEASTAIGSGSPPFAGSFRPSGLLSAVDGISPNGTWQLRIDDVAALDTGTLSNWSLSITTNETGAISDGSGNYSFTGLSAGIHHIREELQAPYQQTSPAGGSHAVTVAVSDNAIGANFGNRLPPGEIHGVVWEDLNNDGIKDVGEPGHSGVTVYTDLDQDGTLDSDEPSTVSLADGSYVIIDVPPGDNIVREVVPSGYAQTSPGQFGAATGAPQGKIDSVSTAPASDPKPAANAFGPTIRPVWAPGTAQKKVDDFYAPKKSAADDSALIEPFTFSDSARWSQTATNGNGLTQGQATTLTWSIVADGVSIPGFNGEPTAGSNLQAFLNGIYGISAVWLSLFEQIFASWSSLTGITYVHELADDGVAFASTDLESTRGVLGVRADVRIGGHLIDGNSNVLAYDFFPNIGDMVIDTGDNFFANNLANNSRGLRNVLAHEHGHGIGLSHVMPVNGTKLMEPFVDLSFDGPQHDDILAANRGYGDRLEQSGGNDTIATAYNLGTIDNGTVNTTNISIDDDSDIDDFRFTAGPAKRATITVNPVGSTYLSGVQGGAAPTNFNSLAQSDLSVQLIAPDGVTVVRTGNANGIGLSETLKNVPLDAGGQFYVKVTGSANAAQLYSITVTIAAALAGAYSVDIGIGQIVNNIDFGNHAITPNGVWDGGGDGTNWIDPINWSNDVLPTSTDDVVIDVDGAQNIQLSAGAQAIHSLSDQENFTISGGTLAIEQASSINGSFTLSAGAIEGAANLTLNGPSNTWSGGTMSGTGNTVIAAGATLNITGLGVSVSTRPLEISGQAHLLAGGDKVLKLSALSLLGSGKLDLNDNKLIVDYAGGASPIDTIQGYLIAGYAGGAWNGNGIISSVAAVTPNRALGLAEATDLFTSFPATFGGQSVDDSAVLIRYTVSGDATLDSVVNVYDLVALATNWLQSSRRWSQGDFTFDQTVNATDLGKLGTNWQQALPQPAPPLAAQSTSVAKRASRTPFRTISLVEGA